jgi:hypothetical protein
MGVACSKHASGMDGGDFGALLLQRQDPHAATGGIPDPEVYDFLRRSVALTQQSTASPSSSSSPTPNHPFRSSHGGGGGHASNVGGGQFHLLYKHQQQSGGNINFKSSSSPPLVSTKQSPFASSVQPKRFPTRLVVRRHPVRSATEEGLSGTHIYAVRWTESINKRGGPLQGGRLEPLHRPEQYPNNPKKKKTSTTHRLLSPPLSRAISTTTAATNTSPTTKSSTSSSMANLTITASDDRDDSGFDIIASPTAAASHIHNVPDHKHPTLSGLIGTSSSSSGACADGNRQLEDRRVTTTTSTGSSNVTGIALTIAPDGGVLVDDALASVSSASLDASLSGSSSSSSSGSSTLSVDHLFRPAAMAVPPKRKGTCWVTSLVTALC